MIVDNLPLVSLILPIRNEATYIERGLQAIFEQQYPVDCMETLLADGMSTDNTRRLIHDFSVLHSKMKIETILNPGKIVPTGFNEALRQAKGEIIIRVDGHTIIASDYVRQCVDTLQKSGAENVGGHMNAIGSNFFGRVVAWATSTPFGIGGGRFHYSDKEEWVDTVYMGAWPKRVFREIGLFDEELVRDQDDEFNFRLREAGGKILLNPKIKSEYAVRSTPQSLWRQYYQYGFWKVRVLQKHPRQMGLRQFVPPAFVFALFVSLVFALFSVSRLFSLTVPLLYLAANLSASVFTAVKKGWKYLLYFPIVFAILHLSYGLGFIVGLFRFWNRWNDKQGKTPVFKSGEIQSA
jgi:cellulose synthase/poly-beta-1,6-N-acetylglucosamine synthase-like glycosyltransferase